MRRFERLCGLGIGTNHDVVMVGAWFSQRAAMLIDAKQDTTKTIPRQSQDANSHLFSRR